MTKPKLKPFDKYALYRRSVQSPEGDVEFLRRTFLKVTGRPARVLREDFCGTFAISCEWVKLRRDHQAHGVDLDPEPIEYGTTNYRSKLSSDQSSRIFIHNANVMSPSLPRADLVCAMNFSYFLFKTRAELAAYFRNCRRNINKKGLLILDCFGGGACQTANEEETKHGNFSYFWHQKNFNPINHHARFAIHFKRQFERKRHDVFTYDWRMWTIPEIREILLSENFSNTRVYWEGTTRRGKGSGIFRQSERGEECESWIAYIVAEV